MGIGELFNEIFGGLGVMLVLYGFGLLAGIILYILNAIGLYNMGKTFSFKAPWLSFIPVASSFALGRIAQEYVKQNGKKSAKFSWILLILNILSIVLTVAFIILFAVAILNIIVVYEDGGELTGGQMLSMAIKPIIIYLAAIICSVAFNVTYYVSLWRVFAIFEKCNATLYTVLSIFFSFLYPIFIFILRKKQPIIFSLQENNEIL